MKSIFILVLSGVACCLALPKCLQDDLAKCFQFQDLMKSEFTEKTLDELCDSLKCAIDVYDRCGITTISTVFPVDIKKSTKDIYDKFCPKTSPLRKKFIKYGKCIFSFFTDKENMQEYISECPVTPIDLENREEFCRKSNLQQKCTEEFVLRKCGEEAAEILKIMNSRDPLCPK